MTRGLVYANHSCDPNASRIPMSTMEEYKENLTGLCALRNIRVGEEITWSYFPYTAQDTVSEDFKNRQKLINRDFGFICTCERCMKERKH